MHVSDTPQEISLTICLDLPNTLPSFQFYQRLKILSLQKLCWSSDVSVYKGKEIQEKTIQTSELPGKRLCLSPTFACRGSTGTFCRGPSKGLLCLWCPGVRGERWQRRSPRARCQARVRSGCAGRGCIRALSLLPRQVTRPCHCPASRREGPTAAWQIGWDFAPKLPAKRPHSQASVFSESRWSDGSDTALTPFNDIFNAKWSGSVRFMELKRQT